MRSLRAAALVVLLLGSLAIANSELPEEIRSLEPDDLARPIYELATDHTLEKHQLDSATVWFRFRLAGTKAKRVSTVYSSPANDALVADAQAVLEQMEFEPPPSRRRRFNFYYPVRLTTTAQPSDSTSKAFLSPQILFPIGDMFERIRLVQKGDTGRAEFRLFISKEGRLQRLVLQSYTGSDRFFSFALDHVTRSQFKPAARNGSPIDCWMPCAVDLHESDAASGSGTRHTVTIYREAVDPTSREWREVLTLDPELVLRPTPPPDTTTMNSLVGTHGPVTVWYKLRVNDDGTTSNLRIHVADTENEDVLAALRSVVDTLTFTPPARDRGDKWWYFRLKVRGEVDESLAVSENWYALSKSFARDTVIIRSGGVWARDSELVYPEFTYLEVPRYPAAALKDSEDGIVAVMAMVDTSGLVVDAATRFSSGFLTVDLAAVRAARQCRFSPARKNGAAVPAIVSWQFEFQLPTGLKGSGEVPESARVTPLFPFGYSPNAVTGDSPAKQAPPGETLILDQRCIVTIEDELDVSDILYRYPTSDTDIIWFECRFDDRGKPTKVRPIYNSTGLEPIARAATAYVYHWDFAWKSTCEDTAWHYVPLRIPSETVPDSGTFAEVVQIHKGPLPTGDIKPVMLYAHPAEYPREAGRDGLLGKVEVRALVDKEGGMEKVRVEGSSGHRILDDAAIKAVQKYRYMPGYQRGLPVNCWVSLTIDFDHAK